MQEECWEGRHKIYIIVSTIPQIFVYVLGIPCAGLMAAFRSRKRRAKMHFSISMFRYGILYSAFGPKRWYWGVVIASRKAFVALITSYLSDPSLEVHWTVAFLCFCIILNSMGQPYTGAQGITAEQALWMQQFDSNSLFVLVITAWSGVFFAKKETYCKTEGEWCAIFLICIVAFNFSFFAYCAWIYRNFFISISKEVYFTLTCQRDRLRKAKRMVIRHQRSSVLHNPLFCRRSFVRKQTVENPLVSAGIDAESLERQQRRRSIEMKAIKVAEKQASRKAHRTKRIRALYRAKTEKEMNKQSAQMGNAPSEDN